MANKKRLIGLIRRLISINSENPPGDESEIAGFIKDYLARLRIRAKIYEFKKNRPNVIAVLGKENGKRSLLITPHLDTVPAGKSWKKNPFSGSIRGNRIYGLGATDCKGNVASCLEAITCIVEEKITLNYNLILAATADEETGSGLGLIPLLDKKIIKPQAALVLDSDEFNIIVTQKGLMHLKIKIQGKRAHGAYPWRGVNAIDIAVEVIKELKGYKFKYPKNKYLKPPTINIGTIRGGDKVNIVADWCEFEADIRFLPGMNELQILKDLKRLIAMHAKKFQLNVEAIQQPYFINENHSLVSGLKKAMRENGIKPVIKGSEGATVITFFRRKNIPAVATGFGSKGCAHTADEYVKIANLYKGANMLKEFLINYSFD
jgi:succinyl-diaminopimelate desuccinylase